MLRSASYIVLLVLAFAASVTAQTVYYSQGNLQANQENSWNTAPLGGGAPPPNFTTAATFIIQPGDSMNVLGFWDLNVVGTTVIINGALNVYATSTFASESLLVNPSGRLYVQAGNQLNIYSSNGGYSDLVVKGKFSNAGSLTYFSSANGIVDSGGVYLHAANGGTIPVLGWQPHSECRVTGVTGATTIGGLAQGFHHFTWASPSQTTAVAFTSQLLSVGGSFTVESTGSGSIVLFNTSATMYAKDVRFNGGTVNFATTNGLFPVINVQGSGYTAFYQSGAGSTIQSSGTGKGLFQFSGVGVKIQQEGTTGSRVGYQLLPYSDAEIIVSDLEVTGDFIVDSAATLYASDGNTNIISGVGNFELRNHGRLYIGHPGGIAATGAVGMVQTDTRTFHSGATYKYVGTSAQVTGSGLPMAVRELVASNPAGVTLSEVVEVTEKLTLDEGPFVVPNLKSVTVDSVVDLAGTGYFACDAYGGVSYMQQSDGQLVLARNSQYGLLQFSGSEKHLQTGTMKVSTAFDAGTAPDHTVENGNTIDYNGSDAVSIEEFNYYDLTISGARGYNQVTFETSDTIGVAGTFSATATFSTGGFMTAGSMLRFSSTGLPTIGPLPGTGSTYHTVIVDIDGGLLQAAGSFTCTGDLVLQNGTFDDAGYVVTVLGDLEGAAGTHTGTGRIVLFNGDDVHTIAPLQYSSVGLDDTNGAQVTSFASFKELVLDDGPFDPGDSIRILPSGSIQMSAGTFAFEPKVTFEGNGTVSGTVNFGSLTVMGDVDLAYGSTVTDTLTILSGGSISSYAPSYGENSTLTYASGGIYARGTEWSSLTGAGHPHHVRVTAGTTLDLGANSAQWTEQDAAGSLTIDAGSGVTLNGSGNQKYAPLTVNGDLLNNGTVTLSSQAGGFLRLRGNLTQDGTLTPNQSAVVFDGSSPQHLYRNGGGYITFDSLVIASSDSVVVPFIAPGTNLGVEKALVVSSGIFFPEGSSIDFANGANLALDGGLLVPSNHVLNFAGSGSISHAAPETVWNVAMGGPVDVGIGLTVLNELKLNTGGSVAYNAPSYGPNATLLYNTGGVADRGPEWSALSGPGYPNHVSLLSSTTLNTGAGGIGDAMAMGGDLTIGSGSTFSMAESGSERIAPLIVQGDVTVNGELKLSNVSGGDLTVNGDWNLSGTFTPNGRSVTFGGVAPALTGPTVFDGMTVNLSGTELTLNDDVTVNAVLSLQNGLVTTGANKLSIGTGGSVSRSYGHINGKLKKPFPVGTGGSALFEVGDAADYAPVEVTFGTVTVAGNVTASTSTTGPDLNGSFIDPAKDAGRYWTLGADALTYDDYSATFHFNSGGFDTSVHAEKFVPRRTFDAQWYVETPGARTVSSTEAVGVNGLGTFAVGQLYEYELSIDSTNGSVLFSPNDVIYPHGTDVQLTAVPPPHYSFTGWTGDIETSDNPVTVTMDGSKYVTAFFTEDPTYSITATSGPHGSISPSGTPVYYYNDTVRFTFSRNENYRVDSVFVNGVPVDSLTGYTFFGVPAASTIHVTFTPDLVPLTTYADYGTVLRSPDETVYLRNTDVTLEAVPDPGYDFTGWSGDTVTTLNPLTITMTDSFTVTANFVYSVPAAPQNLAATAGDSSVSIVWNRIPDPDLMRFRIYKGTAPNPSVVHDSTLAGAADDTSRTFSGLSNYTEYFFRVTAVDSNGHESDFSNEVSAMPTDQTPPAAPLNLASLPGDTSVMLHWSPSAEPDFFRYYIYAGTAIYPTTLVDSTLGGADDTLKSVGGLTNYQQYFFRVRAADTTGNLSGYSDNIGGMPVDQTPPPAPAGVAVADSFQTSFTVRWNMVPGGDVRSYRVYGGLHSETAVLLDTTASVSDTTAVIDTLSLHTRYLFFVTAVDTNGNESGITGFVYGTPYIYYPVNALAYGHGMITPAGMSYPLYGDTLTFTMTPDSGYHIDSVVVDGSSVGVLNDYTFYDITTPHDIAAYFSINQYSIQTYTAGPGTVVPPGATTVSHGDSITLTVTADLHHHIDSLVIDRPIEIEAMTGGDTPKRAQRSSGSGPAAQPLTAEMVFVPGGANTDTVMTYTFNGVTEGHKLEAYFSVNRHAITAVTAGNGAFAAFGDTLAAHGDTIAYCIVPDPYHHLDSVVVDGIAVDSTAGYTFAGVTGPHSITAYFSPNTLDHFLVEADSGGVIGTQTAGQSFLIRTTAVDASNGLIPSFTGTVWFTSTDTTMSVFGGPQSVPFTGGQHGPQLVTFYRAGNHTITVFDSASGKSGTSNVFVTEPGPLNHFTVTDTSGGAVPDQVANHLFFVRMTAHDVYGNVQTNYSGPPEVGVSGAVVTAGDGPTATFTNGVLPVHPMLIASSGYYSINVSDAGYEKSGNSNSFWVHPDTVGIDAVAVDGSISPASHLVVVRGDTVTFTYSPYSGHHFDSVVVDGVAVLDSTSQYTFANVQAPHQIAAYFSLNQYPVTADHFGSGSVSPSGTTYVTHGDSLQFVITAAPFHHIDSLVIDDTTIGGEETIVREEKGRTSVRSLRSRPSAPERLMTGTRTVIYAGAPTDTLMTYTFPAVFEGHTIDAFFSANPNIPPSFTAVLPDTAIARFDTLHFTYAANDPEGGSVTFFIVQGPDSTLIDSLTGAVTFIPAPMMHGIFPLVVEVRDDSVSVFDTAFVRVNLYGDVSGNGVISAFDAAKVLQHTVNIDTLDELQQRVGDVSGAGGISSLDASYILQYSVGLISSFPGGVGKGTAVEAVLAAYAFRIEKSDTPDGYRLVVSVNKPSNTYAMTMHLAFDSAVVAPGAWRSAALTDSMTSAQRIAADAAQFSLAGLRPLSGAGDAASFSFTLKDRNYSRTATLFTMKKFVLNETDHTADIGGIALNVRGLAGLPETYALSQNYPNPFNPATTIEYDLPEAASVRITVYNLLGQEVRTLVSEPMPAGYHSVRWNGRNDDGRPVASGMYLYRIQALKGSETKFVQVKKMLMLK